MPAFRIPFLPEAFRVGSRLRGARVFHPQGVSVYATWRPASRVEGFLGSPLVAEPRPAVLRLSHGIGLPPGLPDLVGLAVKVPDVYGPDRDQDLLFTSSGRGQVSRHLLQPRRQLCDATLSTLLPYRIPDLGRRSLVAGSRPGTGSVTYAEVAADATRCPAFEVRLGSVQGPLLASVEPLEPVPHEIGEAMRYDPWNTGPELTPAGVVNRIRRPTYPASQDGRGAPPGG